MTMQTSVFRASPPPQDVLASLGPLANLPGTWVGKGFNVVALPDKAGGNPFRLKVNATTERITFQTIGGPIPNRGSQDDDIFFLGLHYLQQVSDRASSAGLHVEPGLWLNLPPAADGSPVVSRLATIPHGDSLMSLGTSFVVGGGPQISVEDSTPFTLSAAGVRQNDTNPNYLAPFTRAAVPVGLPTGAVANPNLVLEADITGQNIVNTVVLTVNAAAIGGINGSPVVPATANPVGGILNIPFVVANANANAFSSTFWIETVQNADGSQFMQLQYTQTVILDFIGLKWPHISVATLVKQ